MAKSILSYISGTQHFPDMKFVQENRKSTFHFEQIQNENFFSKIENIYPIFKKFGSLTHSFTWEFVKFQKKIMTQFKENALAGGQKESQ